MVMVCREKRVVVKVDGDLKSIYCGSGTVQGDNESKNTNLFRRIQATDMGKSM